MCVVAATTNIIPNTPVQIKSLEKRSIALKLLFYSHYLAISTMLCSARQRRRQSQGVYFGTFQELSRSMPNDSVDIIVFKKNHGYVRV